MVLLTRLNNEYFIMDLKDIPILHQILLLDRINWEVDPEKPTYDIKFLHYSYEEWPMIGHLTFYH